MERVRGHRHGSRPVAWGAEPGDRHYISAIIGVIGIGLQAYGQFSNEGKGGMTTAQKALLNQQSQFAAEEAIRQREAYEFNKKLQPFILEQMGLEATYDGDGKVRSIRKKLTPQQQREEEITTLAQERTLKALKGELPLDPAVERSLKRDEQANEAYLIKALGPDYKLSTAGQTGEAEGRARRDLVESAVRRGELTQAEAMSRARIDQADLQTARQTATLRGIAGDEARLARFTPPYDANAILDDLRYRGRSGYGASDVGAGLMKGAGYLYSSGLGAKATNAIRGFFGGGSDFGGGVSTSPGYQAYRSGERDLTPYYAYVSQSASPQPYYPDYSSADTQGNY